MLAPTHTVFGVSLTLFVLAIFGITESLHWSIVLIAAIGSIFPDIDMPRSTIGRAFYVISKPIERKWGHRSVTHSLLGTLIATVLFSTLLLSLLLLNTWLPKFFSLFMDHSMSPLPIQSGHPLRWICAFSLGYWSHVILDMFTPRGVQLFWPNSGRDVIPGNAKYRIKTGSKGEIPVFLGLVILLILSLPISKYGLMTSLHWIWATPQAAVYEFHEATTHTFISFRGKMDEDHALIEGVAEILSAKRRELVVRYDGSIYTLSQKHTADIVAENVRVIHTDIPIIIEEYEFEDQTRDELISKIPKNTLISGTVKLPKDLKLDLSDLSSSDYAVLRQKKSVLTLSFASKAQLQHLFFDQFFELSQKRDVAKLTELTLKKQAVEIKISKNTGSGELTELGQATLLTEDERLELAQDTAELMAQRDTIQLQLDEILLKIAAKSSVFSGSVSLRPIPPTPDIPSSKSSDMIREFSDSLGSSL